MRKYNQLKLEDRNQIEILYRKGYSMRNIASVLGCHSSTVSREIQKVPGAYNAKRAHHRAYVKRKYSKYQGMKIRSDMRLEAYITKHLKQHWSPEQIAGRLAKESHLTSVSHTTIYKWLRSVHGRQLEHELDLLKKKRTKSKKPKVIQLEGRVFIEKRPHMVNERKRYGDWEGDFIVSGKKYKTALLVLHERKSRYVLLKKVRHKTAKEVEEALVEIIKPLKHFKSLTLDNDIAFVHHEKISKDLNVPLFFCHPYASWQKGGVENTNLLIRRWIPKGANIGEWSDEDIAGIEHWLNTLPRKILNFKTPLEIMLEHDQLIKSWVQCL